MTNHKGLYKRGNVWWLRYAGPDGKIRFESSRSGSYRAAQALLIKRRKEVQEGKNPIPVIIIANVTFNQLSEHYLVWAARNKSVSSTKKFIRQLSKVFGNLPLRAITTRAIEEYQTVRLTYNKPSTVNRHVGTLKHMIRKATDWEMCEEEILKRARRVKQLPENNRRLRYLSKDECQTLIEACTPHLKPIVIIALNTGMRKGEILSLEWEKHVDLKHGFILLDVTKNGERREVPINGILRETLQGLVRRIDSPYVFVNPDGKRYQDVRRSFCNALKKSGINDFRFHDLRHTFASHLVMAGVDITTVKELLGHKTLTMTLRYAHLSPSHKVKAVELLENTFNERPTIQKLYTLGESK